MYTRQFRSLAIRAAMVSLTVASLGLAPGCRSQPEPTFYSGSFEHVSTEIEYPDSCVKTVSAEQTLAPHTLREPSPTETWDLSLEEAIQLAVKNSRVMREIGARAISAPQSLQTVYDPSLQQTDPRTGEEAALSAFDAQLATSLFLDQDDRSFNNPLFAGAGFTAGAASLSSETNTFLAEVTKVAATGTQFSLSNNTVRTSRNSAFELFPSFYETTMQAEFRHPLLQGSGLAFNRIAGPNGGPGNYNGVLIARIRTDVALADFETAVRNLVEDVQQTYWQLYFAYRNFDARVAARDTALESWRTAKTRFDAGDVDILEESLAREQYYQFQAQVADALSGVGTDTSISQTGFGIYSIERRLRLLLGIEINDGQLIRPADEPLKAEIVFDWNETIDRALFRRVEVRRQQWNIKQREMELIAARNLLMVRLDLVGQYRWRGFGDELLGERSRENGSAVRDLWDGDLQGWQVGVQLSTPIGNRIAHTAVRNAELTLARERVLLKEQERYIQSELSDAFSDLDRAFTQAKNNYNRILSARQRLEAERTRYEIGDGVLQFVFEAQSRLADAEAEYFRSLVDYNLAIAKVHYGQGTLLDYLGVHLAEGPWSSQAYASAAKQSSRFAPRELNYCMSEPCYVSRGAYPQNALLDVGAAVPLASPTEAVPGEATFMPDSSDLFESPDPPSTFELDPADVGPDRPTRLAAPEPGT